MKRLTPHSTWWHRVPHRKITRSQAQEKGASHGPYWYRRAQEGKPDLYVCDAVAQGEDRPTRCLSSRGSVPARQLLRRPVSESRGLRRGKEAHAGEHRWTGARVAYA